MLHDRPQTERREEGQGTYYHERAAEQNEEGATVGWEAAAGWRCEFLAC